MIRLLQKKLLLMALIISCVACGDEDTLPKTEPINSEYTLTSKSTNIVELKQINNGGEVVTLNSSEVERYFGDRLQYATPKEFQFKENSVTIVLHSDLKREYQFKWVDKGLYIRTDSSGDWVYCAEKDGAKLIVNLALFNQSNDNKNRTLRVVGQCNHFKSYSELLGSSELMMSSSVVWLRAESLFE